MKISKEEVKKIASLAKLNLSEDEINEMQKDMSGILEYMDKLNTLNTNDVEPLSYPVDIKNVFREDIPGESLDREEALKNAPARTEEFFKVPKVI